MLSFQVNLFQAGLAGGWPLVKRRTPQSHRDSGAGVGAATNNSDYKEKAPCGAFNVTCCAFATRFALKGVASLLERKASWISDISVSVSNLTDRTRHPE